MRPVRRTQAVGLLLCLAAFGGTAAVTSAVLHDPGAARRGEVRSVLEDRYYRPLAPDVLDAALASPDLGGLGPALGDPYTRYLTPEALTGSERADNGRYVGVGVVLAAAPGGGTVVADLVEGSPAARAGLAVGDRIVAVDGTPVAGLGVPYVLARLRGAAGAPVGLVWTGAAGQGGSATVTRQELDARIVAGRLATVAGHRVGIVAVTAFDDGAGDQVRAQVARLSGAGAEVFLLDLRGNGGGLVAETLRVTSAFVAPGTPVFTERGAHVPTRTYSTSLPAVDVDRPVAVLVDGETASAAEIVSGALRVARRAPLVGARTFGKGVIQDTERLADGGALALTVAVYLTPDGAALDHRGLDPDVPAAAAVPGGPDPAVDAAVRATSR
jgi:carboxyl-terminal processing protease